MKRPQCQLVVSSNVTITQTDRVSQGRSVVLIDRSNHQTKSAVHHLSVRHTFHDCLKWASQ